MSAPLPPPDQFAGPNKPQNGLGIASLVLGIVSIVLCCAYAGIWAGIPAVVLGYLSMNKAKQGLATNRGLALAGLITGAIGVALAVILIILVIIGKNVDWPSST